MVKPAFPSQSESRLKCALAFNGYCRQPRIGFCGGIYGVLPDGCRDGVRGIMNFLMDGTQSGSKSGDKLQVISTDLQTLEGMINGVPVVRMQSGKYELVSAGERKG